MRIVELLGVLAPLAAAAAALLLGSRRRVVRAFERGRAFDPDSAIPPPVSASLAIWWRSRLHCRGVLQRTAEGLEWLDRPAWLQYRRARRRRALAVAGALMVLAAILLLRTASASWLRQ